MTFTYTGTLASELEQVRFRIADTVASEGPKPNDGNFSDEELDGLLSCEGSVERTVAAAYEALAALWAKHQTFTSDGVSVQQGNVAAHYRAEAKRLRDRVGYSGAGAAGSEGVIRADGYSDDLDDTQVDDEV